MAENTTSPADTATDKFKRTLAFFIAVATLLAAVLAYWQADASVRDNRANRDTKRYALEAFGREASGDARVNFDYVTAYQTQYELGLLADAAENRGDALAAERYRKMAEEATKLSPMLQSPYYDPAGDAEPNDAKYEADLYVVEITALRERFNAASQVKDAWDSKANTYILHLTLLAVALFMFGLSTTIAGPRTRWVFAGIGLGITAFAMLWALTLYVSPVFDAREQGSAIDSYAQGVGLAHQGLNEEAIASFDKALADYPQYISALQARGEANMSMGNYAAAIADYEQSRAAGDTGAITAGNLGWAYYMLGDFDKATQANQDALAQSPDELWIQFDQALNLLASGQTDAAMQAYQAGMDSAAKQVADAKAAGKEPPSYLWSSLSDAAESLDALLWALTANEVYASPTPDKIQNQEAVIPAAEEQMRALKSLALALEYTGAPPAAKPAAEIGELLFVEPIYDEQFNIVDYSEPQTSFAAGLQEFIVQFDYSQMQAGQEITFRLYADGIEDPSWRSIFLWELGESGKADIPLSYAYSDTFTFAPGFYTVEIYVNYHLVQIGYFEVQE
jgi:tetratricopeptide (TPR) repeat protein